MKIPPDWPEDITDLLLVLIRQANRGRVPASLEEWETVAERFLRELYIVRTHGRSRGVLYEDVLVVKWTSEQKQLFSRIAHELGEYLLCSEWEPPVCVPPTDPERQRHDLARLLELKVLLDAVRPERDRSPEPLIDADFDHDKEFWDGDLLDDDANDARPD